MRLVFEIDILEYPVSNNQLYRWNQAAPTGSLESYWQRRELTILAGVPHRSLEDDVYEGMFIPKGSILIANTRYLECSGVTVALDLLFFVSEV